MDKTTAPISRRITTALVAVAVVVAGSVPAALAARLSDEYVAVTSSPDKPTDSRYVNWLHGETPEATSEHLGCLQAKDTNDGYVLLGLGRQIDGGATAFGWSGKTRDTAGLASSMVAFAKGVQRCVQEGAHWHLVLMTSNYHLNDVALAGVFGKQWAELVETVRRSANSESVEVHGGWDLEPSWGSPEAARAWTDAYVSNTKSQMISAPSADGCPVTPNGTACNNGWSQGLLAYMMWGAQPGAAVLPQIYTPSGSMAKQWAFLSDAAVRAGIEPTVLGALTQSRACQGRPCSGTNITPDVALAQLEEAFSNSELSRDVTFVAASDINWG
jgi:hypothetical protein